MKTKTKIIGIFSAISLIAISGLSINTTQAERNLEITNPDVKVYSQQEREDKVEIEEVLTGVEVRNTLRTVTELKRQRQNEIEERDFLLTQAEELTVRIIELDSLIAEGLVKITIVPILKAEPVLEEINLE